MKKNLKVPTYLEHINEGKNAADIIDGEYSFIDDNDGLSDNDFAQMQKLAKKNKITNPVAIFDYTVDVVDMKKVEKILKSSNKPFANFTTEDDGICLIFDSSVVE